MKEAWRDIFLLLMIALFTNLTATADDDYSGWWIKLHGDFNDWNSGDHNPTDGIWTESLSKAGGFDGRFRLRIWKGEEYQPGNNSVIPGNNTFTQLSGNDVNMWFPADAVFVTGINVTYDCPNNKLKFEYTSTPTYPETLYAFGDGAGGEGWIANKGVASTTHEGSVYTFKDLDLTSPSVSSKGYAYIRFASQLGSDADDWGNGVNAAPHFGPLSNNAELSIPSNDNAVRGFSSNPGGANVWKIPAGKYDITVDLHLSTISIKYAEVIVEDDEEVIPETIYMIGHVEGHNWATDVTKYADKENGVFTFENLFIADSGNGYGYFRLAKVLGANMDAVNAEDVYGPELMNDDPTTAHTIVRYSAKAGMSQHAPNWALPKGCYDITIDLDNKTITAVRRDYPDTLFLIGNCNGMGWDIRQGIRAECDHGVYVFRNVHPDGAGGFNFIETPSPDKIADIYGKRRYGAASGRNFIHSEIQNHVGLPVKFFSPDLPEDSRPNKAATFGLDMGNNHIIGDQDPAKDCKNLDDCHHLKYYGYNGYFNVILDINEMKVYAEEATDYTPVPSIFPEHLYVYGDLNETMGSPIAGVESETVVTDGLYEFKSVRIEDSGDGFGYFSFITQLGDRHPENGDPMADIIRGNIFASEGWKTDDNINKDLNQQVTVSSAKRLYLYPTNVSADKAIPFKVVPGTYDIKVDMRTGTVEGVVKETMTIMVTPAEAPYQFVDNLYLIGHVKGYSWVTSRGIKSEKLNNGVYKFTDVKVNNCGDGYGYFSFVTSLGENWDVVNSYNRYGAPSNNDPIVVGTSYGNDIQLYAADINASSAQSYKLAEGWYDITVDLNTMKVTTVLNTEDHSAYDEAFPSILFLIGDVNDYAWNPNYGVVAEGIDGVYEFDNVKMTANGKFVGYFSFATRLGSWDDVNTGNRYGAVSTDAPAIFETYLDVRVFAGGGNAGSCNSWMISPGTYKITLNLNEMSLYVVDKAYEVPDIPYAEKVYVIGNVNGYGWAPNRGVEAQGHGVYQFNNVTIDDSGDGYGYFSLATQLGEDEADWTTLNGGNRYGAQVDDDGHEMFLNSSQYDLTQIYEYVGDGAGNAKAWKALAGVYDITADFTCQLPTLIMKKSLSEDDLNDTYEYTHNWFSKVEYVWKSRTREYHVNNLGEPATDPDQQMAFVARVYSTRYIPGSKEIYYHSEANPKDGADDDTNMEDDEVNLIYRYDGNNYYRNPAKPSEMLHPVPTVPYPGMDAIGVPEFDELGNEIDYTPSRHGITALLVELNIPEVCQYPYIASPADTPESQQNWSTVNAYIKYIHETFTGKEKIDEEDPDWLFKNTTFYKSISVLTEREHVRSADNPGYLFNINKPLRHFFVVVKGQPRKKNWDDKQTTYFDIFNYFEQISPTVSDVSQTAQQEYSAIDRLREGYKYRVIHDCSSVIYQDHYFCMDRHLAEKDEFGNITNIDDAGDYEVGDNIYLYIPSARFTYWDREDTNLLAYAEEKGIKIDPKSYGRDHNISGSTVNPIGAYTYYHPKYAPYFFMYEINLSVDGHRPMIDGAYDEDHFQVELTWKSTLTDVTNAHMDGLTEEFHVYRIVDGVISESPLNISDLADVPEGMTMEQYLQSMVPDTDRDPETGKPYTTVSLEEDGTIHIASLLPEVHLNILIDKEIDAPTTTESYIVGGRVYGDIFSPVFSNDADITIYGTQTMVPARLNREETTCQFYVNGDSDLNIAPFTNHYVNTIQLFRDPKFTSNLTRGDIVPGSTTFYLMRTDKTDAQGEDRPIAYFKIMEEYDATGDTSRGGAVKAYKWKAHQMPGYTESKLTAWFYQTYQDEIVRYSAETDNYFYIWSPSEGNSFRPASIENDIQAIVYPSGFKPDSRVLTNLNGYIEFSDEFDESVVGNNHPGSYTYYFIYDKKGELYNTDTGVKATGKVRDPKNYTNKVTVVIPRSAILSSLQTYTSGQVKEDLDHHLPLNKSQMHMAITNIATLNSFNVYKQHTNTNTNTLVGITRRNGDRNFETFSVNNRNYTSHGVTKEYDDDDYARVAFPLHVTPQPNDSYYGVIVSSLGNTYGVDKTPGVLTPSLEILDAKLCQVVEDNTGVDGYPTNYRVGQKWLVPDFSALEADYDVEITHFNVWRTCDSKHFTGDRNESIIRYHGSDTSAQLHPSDPSFNSFNDWEYFVQKEMEDGRMGYLQKDGVQFAESVEEEDETPVTYYARVYAHVTPKKSMVAPNKKNSAGNKLRNKLVEGTMLDGKNNVVIAESKAIAKFNLSNTTGVEDVRIEAATELSVRNVGNCVIEIKGEGRIEIYNLAGLHIASVDDDETVRCVDLPAPGLYIVGMPGKAVKIAVK